jgi:putative oxidoreductase
MAIVSIAITFFVRCLLVGLFLPFSALDKILNFRTAVMQASRATKSRPIATILIAAGFCVEVFMSLAVITGVADRLAAFVLAGYCVVTALLWKQFWNTPDFRLEGESRGREMFWDFLKNIALAGGFLVLAFGVNASGVTRFIHHPFESSHPYASAGGALP